MFLGSRSRIPCAVSSAASQSPARIRILAFSATAGTKEGWMTATRLRASSAPAT